jgi:hypothetical protein
VAPTKQPDVAVVRVRVAKNISMPASDLHQTSRYARLLHDDATRSFIEKNCPSSPHLGHDHLLTGHNLRRRQTVAQRRSDLLLKGCMIMAHDNGDGDVQTDRIAFRPIAAVG